MFGKKKKKDQIVDLTAAPASNSGAPCEQDYVTYLKKAEEMIDLELKSYKIAAENLKVSSKKIARIKGVYSNKISRGKMKRYGVKINNYKDSLDSYVATASRLTWLLDTYASCREGLARLSASPAKARKLRQSADKYAAGILYKKGKIERITDGIVMPVATYVK